MRIRCFFERLEARLAATVSSRAAMRRWCRPTSPVGRSSGRPRAARMSGALARKP